jgi:DNA polymerase-3 subunit delta
MAMDALTFLESASTSKPQPIYVLHGDEDLLKRHALAAIRALVFGTGEGEFDYATHSGATATFAEVRSELDTLPFLSAWRLVVVHDGDPFVSTYRAALEKYVGETAERGILVLEVRTWPSTTRLAKMLKPAATIVCKAPAARLLPEWAMQWSESHHGKQLVAPAARLLVDLIGADLGQLDQELAKLAVYVGSAARIEMPDVDKLVGQSRTESAFKIFDAIAEGRPGEALVILNRLFEQGEDPLRILGAFSMNLRRLAQAARLAGQGRPVGAALYEVGVPPFARESAENQLRHLGRRSALLYDWLLEADQGLKGGSQLPPRTILERLLVRLAAPEP